MEINALNLNRAISNTTKTNTKASNNDAFDKVLEKSNQTNFKSSEKPKSDNVDASKDKPLSKEEKDVLKQAGMSDKEIESIKSEQDLKETLTDKILSGKPEENEDISSLLAILMSLMKGNFDNTNYMNIKNAIDKNSGNVEKLINILSNFTANSKSNTDLLGMLKKELSPDMVQALNLNDDGILEKIKTEFSAILSNEEKNDNITKNLSKSTEEVVIDKEVNPLLNNTKAALKNVKDDSNTNKNDNLEDVKDAIKNIKGEQIEAPVKNNKKSSDANLMMEDGNSKSSDEDFLKKLLSDNSNDKISKVTNFMTQFNNTKVENVNVTEIGNLVVNKNNFSADMIKSIKYMELNNIKDLTVKINPKELGEVVIKLTMEAGAMKATITAANKEAFNLLNSNLTDMTNKLQNSDIKVQSLALNIYNEDTTFFKDGSNNRQNNEENKGRKSNSIGAITEEEAIDNVSSIDSNVNMLA